MRSLRKITSVALVIGISAALLVGCDSGSAGSDPTMGKKAADAAPKSADNLPSTMPAEAKASAAAAMGQAQAQEKMGSDPARVKAMQMMRQQGAH